MKLGQSVLIQCSHFPSKSLRKRFKKIKEKKTIRKSVLGGWVFLYPFLPIFFTNLFFVNLFCKTQVERRRKISYNGGMTGCPPQTFFLFSSFLNLSLIKINNIQTFSRSWIYFALDLSWWPWVALLFERKMVQKLIWAWHATSGGAKTAAEPNKWANNKCTNNTRKIFNGRWIDCTNNLIWLPRALILGQKNDSILFGPTMLQKVSDKIGGKINKELKSEDEAIVSTLFWYIIYDHGHGIWYHILVH